MKQSELLELLISTSKQLNEKAQELDQLDLNSLSKRPKEGAWNALECFEHLNLYIDIYNDFFAQAIEKAIPLQNDAEIKRGYWGNRFINWMEPKEKGMTKMNTFKSKNPIGQEIKKEVIQHFISSNSKTLQHLEMAQTKDIQKARCKLALPLLTLKLSDAFHFLINHNQRHMIQIQKAVS